MAYGKAIELFLVDGDANGLITAELSNWNGKAIKIPRTDVKDCMAQFVREIARKLCMAIICAALLVCGGIIHSAEPLVGGISWYSLICFLLSAALSAWEFWWKGRNQE